MRKIYLFFISVAFVFTASAQGYENLLAQQLVVKNAASIGFTNNDLGNYVVSSSYFNEPSGTQMVYVNQTFKGLPVYNQMIVLAFKDGKLISKAGSFLPNMESLTKGSAATPAVMPADAVRTSITDAKVDVPAMITALNTLENGKKYDFGKLNIAAENITAELMWVPVIDGGKAITDVKLAWQVQLFLNKKVDYLQVRVDAKTNTIVNKNSLTVSENFDQFNTVRLPAFMMMGNAAQQKVFSNTSKSQAAAGYGANAPLMLSPSLVTTANYTVIPYPAESPIHPGGTAAVRTNPWTLAGGNAVSLKWHNDGTTDYITSRGNNVYAQEDRDNNNATFGLTATSTTSPDPLNFTYAGQPNYTVDPTTAGFQQFAITNLFYMNNILHDVTYNHGFTEPAGNFQNDNQGRGGAGVDYVIADAQDAGGTNNANMSTPADGARPRMQMYLWSPTRSATTMIVNTPGSIAGPYTAVEGSFSTANQLANVGPVTAQVIYYNDVAASTHDACVTPSNGGPLTGKIALINRGNCNFTVKVKNAQDAGAVAVIMVNNVAGAPIVMGGGPDPTIIIPAVMISDVDGATIAAQLANNVNVTLSGTPPGTQNLDGDIDNGIVQHEFFHGVSNRLTGGPANSSCLGNAEQGGEGWSDYMALMGTTNWATAVASDGANKPRAIGNYAFGYPVTGPGIRTYPYCTNIAVNPLTYANLGTGAYASEVHNIGEIWCNTIWEMTWQLIQSRGISANFFDPAATGGNVVAFRLVMEGMKLQPCSPGYIDARNAIIQADKNLYGGADTCAIWTAFAKRGMGFGASQGSSNSTTDQVASFTVPPACLGTAPSVTINQAAAQADPTSTSPINFTVVFDQAVTGFTTGDVTLTGTAGATTGTVTGSGTTYNVAVSGMTSSGTVIATIAAGVCQNASSQNNNASTSTDNTVTFSLPAAPPNVTINQAAAQADPTSTSPINFTVAFDQAVSGFTTGDVTLSGTAGATTGTVTGGPITYNVAVSGMTGSGTVIASIAAGVCQNGSAQPNNASTSTDNTVTYNAPPGCTSVNPVPSDTLCNGSTHAAVVFSSPTPGTTFSWVNNTPSIGLAASGTGNLPAFVATNVTLAPVVATIIVTPTLTTVTPTTTTFNFTGGAQTFTVPAGVTSINFTALGAEGGSGATGTNNGGTVAGGAGGKGSRATGTLAVTAGQVINIFVGGAGGTPTAGFNGGGTGGSANAGGGGGASDVRFPGAASADRILVAGGGAGGGRGGCEGIIGAPGAGGAGGNGDGNGTDGANSVTTGGFAGGGFGAIGVAPGLQGIGCAGFLGAPGLAGSGPAGGNGGAGQSCCCFNFQSIPGGGGGGGGFLGGAGGGGGSAGTVGCSGNDKGAGGGGAGGTSYTGGVTAGVITTNIQSGNGQVVLNYNVTTTCTGPTRAFTITVNPTPTVNAVANQTVCAGSPTAAVNFTGTPAGVSFIWTNNNTAIGLAAAGTGNIPSFIATNPTNAAITGTITVTPQTVSGSASPGGPVSFSNSANIAIPASGTGSGTGSASNPYPSNISVTGLPTTGVTVQSVTLTNIQHTWSDDIGVLLVGPNGEKFVPMARVGGSGGFDATATVTLKDGSPLMPTGTAAIPSGTYGPTAGATAIWPAPAPGTPYNYPTPTGTATFANTFNNTSNYNGTWSLYVTDMAAGDVGNIAGGWGITLVTPAVPGLVCSGTSRTFTITVNPNPALIIVADPGTTICEGDPTLLTVYDVGAISAPGTLYTQGTTPVNGSPSQVFEPVNTAFNSQSADDFVVPAGGNWNITGVTANGIGTGAPTSVNVFFYTNSASNLPGTAIASFNNITTFTNAGGNYTVTLPSAVALTAGRYWMSLQVNMAFATGGQWFWGNYGAPIVGNQYAWQNPGGGFATPCTTWGYGGTGCNVGGGAANVNNIFSIVGTSVGLGPQSTGTFLWSPALGLSSTTSNPVAASPQNTTTYTVTRTLPGGCSRSAQVTITVNKRPVVTTQPVSRVNCSGTTASFTVGGTGTGLTYQWQVSTAGCAGPWVNVSTLAPYGGGTTPTLTITPVDGTMNGYAYRCILTGICAPWIPPTNVSNCATLTVNPLPNLVVTPPVSCGGVAGISGTALTVTQLPPPVPGTVTVNSGAINVPIPDGTNVAATSNLTVAGIPANATITDAKVNININHTWVGDVNVNLKAPNGAILDLVSRLDNGAGGNLSDDFTNTTFSSLSSAAISGAAAPRTGTFAAEARAGSGPIGYVQTVSTWAGLYPTATAANGVWTLAMGDAVGTDVGALTNWSITINYNTPGSGPLPTLSYVWTPFNGLYTLPNGTGAYSGQNLATVYAAPTAQTTYTVTATNVATGCVGTATALVNYTPPAPTVVPSSVTMCLGDPAVKLKSSSSTTTTVAFNSGTIAVAIPDNNQAGAAHTIAVSGIPANATVTGMRVKMTIPHTFIGDLVIALKAPNNNVLNLDFYLSNTFGGVTTGFSNTIFTSAAGAPAVSTGSNPYSSQFRPDGQIAATGNGPAAPTGYTANMANYGALIGSLTPANVNGNYTLAMYDGGAIDVGTLTNWEIEFTYVVGVPASPAVWSPALGLFSDAAALTPYVAGTAVDSVWTRPTPSGVYTYTAVVNNLITTLATPTTPMAGGNGNNLVTFNVKNNNTFPVTLSSLSSNTFGSGAVTSTVFYKNVGNAGNPGPISAANGFIQIGSAASTVTAGAMNLLVSGMSLQVPAGATYAIALDMTGATFPAYTNGTAATVTYSNGGCDIITSGNVGWGGPNAPAAPVNNPRNFNGSITFLGSGPGTCQSPGRTVTVTVNDPATLNSNLPANQTICTDKVATFTTVTTGGTGPFSYQWQVSTNNGNPPWTNVTNGGVYSGATTATLTITAPPVSMSGYQYRVLVNGAAPCAAAISRSAILTVNPLPVIVISASPYTSLFPGLTTTLSSTVTPNAASTYSWIRNGVVLTSPAQGVLSGLGTGSIKVDVDGMGDYSLRVTDVNGCTNTSNTVTIKDSASGRCFIYPNPNSGQFQVRYYSVANNVLPRGIVVYDAKGDRVLSQNYTIGRPYDRMDVDMRAKGKGLYWVEIVDRNGNRLTMCRVVIQ